MQAILSNAKQYVKTAEEELWRAEKELHLALAPVADTMVEALEQELLRIWSCHRFGEEASVDVLGHPEDDGGYEVFLTLHGQLDYDPEVMGKETLKYNKHLLNQLWCAIVIVGCDFWVDSNVSGSVNRLIVELEALGDRGEAWESAVKETEDLLGVYNIPECIEAAIVRKWGPYESD